MGAVRRALRSGPGILFTKPVRADTVHPGPVFLTAILWERQADYLLTRRIPAVPQPLDARGGYDTRFRLCVNPSWIHHEIDSRSELKGGGRIELTLRGQMIRNRCGNLLGSVPLGHAPGTPPHGRPGGDFVALLRFAAETRAPPLSRWPERRRESATPAEAAREPPRQLPPKARKSRNRDSGWFFRESRRPTAAAGPSTGSGGPRIAGAGMNAPALAIRAPHPI